MFVFSNSMPITSLIYLCIFFSYDKDVKNWIEPLISFLEYYFKRVRYRISLCFNFCCVIFYVWLMDKICFPFILVRKSYRLILRTATHCIIFLSEKKNFSRLDQTASKLINHEIHFWIFVPVFYQLSFVHWYKNNDILSARI